ncbi:MAG: hypothetical protein WA958_03980 [Tunicatimonas sp.]
MKYANKLVATVAILSTLLTLGCGGGEDPSPDGVPGEVLAATWEQDEPGDVTGGPAAADFTNFRITISTTTTPGELNYSTQNNGNTLVFPNSGTFTLPEGAVFSPGVAVQVAQNDGKTVDLSLTADDQLRMVVLVNENSSIPHGNSRTAEISGTYTFLLDKAE